jgi:hypothetical protein
MMVFVVSVIWCHRRCPPPLLLMSAKPETNTIVTSAASQISISLAMEPSTEVGQSTIVPPMGTAATSSSTLTGPSSRLCSIDHLFEFGFGTSEVWLARSKKDDKGDDENGNDEDDDDNDDDDDDDKKDEKKKAAPQSSEPLWLNAPCHSPLLVSARRVAMVSHLFNRLDNICGATSTGTTSTLESMTTVSPPPLQTKRPVVETVATKSRNKKKGWITILGNDVWINIMTYSDISSLCNGMRICRWFCRMIRTNDYLWWNPLLIQLSSSKSKSKPSKSKDSNHQMIQTPGLWYSQSYRQYYLQQIAMKNHHADIYLPGFGVETNRPVTFRRSIRTVFSLVHPGKLNYILKVPFFV